MGLGLQVIDFKNLLTRPTGLFVGLAGQVIVLPAVAAGLASLAEAQIVAVGLLLIGVCPGGTSSNYFSYLARGDVALSISLTAVTGLICVATVPLVFNFFATQLLATDVAVYLPVVDTMRGIFLYLVLPVIVGMTVRRFRQTWAEKWQPRLANGSFALLLILTPTLVVDYYDQLVANAADLLLWVSIMIMCMMSIGFTLGRLFSVPARQVRSLTVEIGIQNVALAIFLALVFLDDVRFVGGAIAYLIMMYVFVPGFVYLCRRSDAATALPASSE